MRMPGLMPESRTASAWSTRTAPSTRIVATVKSGDRFTHETALTAPITAPPHTHTAIMATVENDAALAAAFFTAFPAACRRSPCILRLFAPIRLCMPDPLKNGAAYHIDVAGAHHHHRIAPFQASGRAWPGHLLFCQCSARARQPSAAAASTIARPCTPGNRLLPRLVYGGHHEFVGHAQRGTRNRKGNRAYACTNAAGTPPPPCRTPRFSPQTGSRGSRSGGARNRRSPLSPASHPQPRTCALRRRSPDRLFAIPAKSTPSSVATAQAASAFFTLWSPGMASVSEPRSSPFLYTENVVFPPVNFMSRAE